jgi:hypothetical protein
MIEIEELFGGNDAEEYNVLYTIIKNRGYKYFEETPKTSMTFGLIKDLHELGYEIVKKTVSK